MAVMMGWDGTSGRLEKKKKKRWIDQAAGDVRTT
jgi:hypothetical protein